MLLDILFYNEESADVDYSKFDITFLKIVSLLNGELGYDSRSQKRSEANAQLLFDTLFRDALNTPLAQTVIDDEVNKINLISHPYRARKNSSNEIKVGAWDNLKDILSFFSTYFGASTANIMSVYDKVQRSIVDSNQYELDRFFDSFDRIIKSFQSELSKLISRSKKNYKWYQEGNDKFSASREKKKLELFLDLYEFWFDYFDLVDRKYYNKAISYLIFYSILNTDVVLLSLKGNLPFKLKRTSRICEGKKYLISSSINNNLYIGFYTTDHMLDTEEDYRGEERDLLSTKIDDGFLSKEFVTIEFEFINKECSNGVYCRIKMNNKYLRANGLFRRSYLELVNLTPNSKKTDRTIWKIEYSDSENDPYIIIRSAAPFPYSFCCLDISNGNYNVNNLLFWLFPANASGSQKFYLNELIEDEE
ncbi:MAG: hypothetical protein IJM51_02670 [Clostridia bacterium]|nr:hypothetical protein [Clostridia bacterium]